MKIFNLDTKISEADRPPVALVWIAYKEEIVVVVVALKKWKSSKKRVFTYFLELDFC